MDTLVALLLIAGMPGGMEWLILLAVLLVPTAVLAGVFAIGYGVGRSHATQSDPPPGVTPNPANRHRVKSGSTVQRMRTDITKL